METTINNFRVNDLFWVHFHKAFTSFGHKGLPKDVHFTLSYNEECEDVNIHLTRNTGDPKNKPQIGLVKINKKLLEKVGPYSLLDVIKTFLKPIDLTEFLNNGSEIKFMPIESLEKDGSTNQFEHVLFKHFKPITKVGKSRLKVKGPLEDKFLELISSEELSTSMDELYVDLKQGIESTRGGIFYHENKTFAIVKYNDVWYEYTTDVTSLELLSSVVGKDWAKIIARYTKRALAKIRHATTYNETKQFDQPIVLVANPEFEKAIEEYEKSQNSEAANN